MYPVKLPEESDNSYLVGISSDHYLTSQQTIGMLVRRLRQMNNCTQHDLAYLSGTDPSYLSKIERGNSRLSVNKFMQLSGALEIGEDKLIHMSRQIAYSAHLYKKRSSCSDELKAGKKQSELHCGYLSIAPEPRSGPDKRKSCP